MNLNHMVVCQQIARAAREFERGRTTESHEWVAIFLNEETVVIALHSALTNVEVTFVGSPAGCARVVADKRRLFAQTALHRKIESICGMGVRDTTVEIDPTTSSMVVLFTTDTVGAKLPLSRVRPLVARVRTPGEGLNPKDRTQRPTRTTGCVIRA